MAGGNTDEMTALGGVGLTNQDIVGIRTLQLAEGAVGLGQALDGQMDVGGRTEH
jgi:hypothetical protein